MASVSRGVQSDAEDLWHVARARAKQIIASLIRLLSSSCVVCRATLNEGCQVQERALEHLGPSSVILDTSADDSGSTKNLLNREGGSQKGRL